MGLDSVNKEQAVIVQLDLNQGDLPARLSEMKLLVQSAGADVVDVLTGRRDMPDPALFVGKGKADQLADIVKEKQVDVIVFNHSLSPSQQRNLENKVQCRVIDRTALILDIFALRAKSHEGKLQVELAQLEYLSTRLVRGWTHLERQKGGIGLRGPGETQLETDRRLLGIRLKNLKKRLELSGKQRQQRRRARERSDILSVSLVGYTNAGKSTLFNALTKVNTYAADQLFATLDTMSRKTYVGDGASVVLSDTVGFIRDLPHALVDAFRSTLEETAQADLLLHVVDFSDESREQQIVSVNQVLKEIGAEQIPQILIYNKVDLTTILPTVHRDEYGRIQALFVSAQQNSGLGALRELLAERSLAKRNLYRKQS